MCGEHAIAKAHAADLLGSSPHVRGAHRGHAMSTMTAGIIPACAGSTISVTFSRIDVRDHPRMCGEHRTRYSVHTPFVGSSPHVRGALQRLHLAFVQIGIIPACAGSTSSLYESCVLVRDHPRMCGEHLREIGQETAQQGSSPHVRGAQVWDGNEFAQTGIIPACAGSTQV